MNCHGFRVSGYWKGYRCGAIPKYRTEDGKTWCKSHLPVGQPAQLLEKKK